MCCSGNHNHGSQNSHQSSKNSSSARKFHFPMMLCCLVPILLLILSANGIGGNISKFFPFLMIAICLGSHFFMNGHSHTEEKDCCKNDNQISQNSTKTDN